MRRLSPPSTPWLFPSAKGSRSPYPSSSEVLMAPDEARNVVNRKYM